MGDHGIAVMLAREQFGLRGDLKSDAASVLPLTRALRAVPGLRFMRDPTRGGLATVAHEIVQVSGLGVGCRKRTCRCATRCARCARCSATTRISSPAKAASWRSSPRTMRIARSPRCARRRAGRDAAIIGRVREQPARVRARDHDRRRARDRGTRGRSAAADLLGDISAGHSPAANVPRPCERPQQSGVSEALQRRSRPIESDSQLASRSRQSRRKTSDYRGSWNFRASLRSRLNCGSREAPHDSDLRSDVFF